MSFRLVHLQVAIDHLNESDDNKEKVLDKLKQASAIVLKHMGYSDIPDGQYDETTSPPTLHPVYYDTDISPPLLTVSDNVKSAVLIVLGEIWENREASVADVLSSTVTSLLETSFDPPFA